MDASTFPLKTIEITTKHLILCSSINMWGENPYNYTTISRDPLRIWGYGWGESESLKTCNNLEGHAGKRVLDGENHQKTAHVLNCLNWGALPPNLPS